tara:strand:+ start:1699 stop:1845 length:147 start_codon:yes stop_codon:yes gene_type:complete
MARLLGLNLFFVGGEGGKEPVHGPRDWYHPNKKGYEAIARGILENTSF